MQSSSPPRPARRSGVRTTASPEPERKDGDGFEARSSSEANTPALRCPRADMPHPQKEAEEPKRLSALPEKPRFFGSSGQGALLLALDRSRKTHQEEVRRRAEREGHDDPEEQHHAGTTPVSRGEETSKTGTDKAADASVPAMSQETDYDDPELDTIDFLLDLDPLAGNF